LQAHAVASVTCILSPDLFSLLKYSKAFTTIMATQEHMDQFGDTSSDGESDASPEELMPPKTPKLKLKFKMPKHQHEGREAPMPVPTTPARLSQDAKTPSSAGSEDTDNAREMAIPEETPSRSEIAEPVPVKAETIRSEPVSTPVVVVKAEDLDDSEDVVNASIVEDDEDIDDEAIAVAEPVYSGTSAHQHPQLVTKKRQSLRPIKLPAIASPGLLLVNGKTTAALFDHHMKNTGYSLEARVNHPFRGSSTQRQVGDLFDSNVILHRNFPNLVPPELMEASDDNPEKEAGTQPKLIEILEKGLKVTTANTASTSGNTRKRRFAEMLPLSLLIDYPQDYIERRKEYVKKVKEREAAIVEAQEAELEDKKPGKIPPIPDLPEAPRLTENEQDLDLKDKHPFYPPKNDDFVKHLDPNCFHAVEGRYVGLSTNSLSDPHYVGACAVGVQNLSVTAGTGLATTQTGSTGAGSASLASTVYGDRSKDSKDKKSDSSSKGKAVSNSGQKKKMKSTSSSGTVTELKNIMESDTPEMEEMRKCIIRAGVYASRTGRHGQSFLGPNGHRYADVSKTFAVYAGIKPCNRCKNNKQGAYHCRLRRKHKEPDYDGGDSLSTLTPLFDEPLDNLILKEGGGSKEK
jgi:hypothetical protein